METKTKKIKMGIQTGTVKNLFSSIVDYEKVKEFFLEKIDIITDKETLETKIMIKDKDYYKDLNFTSYLNSEQILKLIVGNTLYKELKNFSPTLIGNVVNYLSNIGKIKRTSTKENIVKFLNGYFDSTTMEKTIYKDPSTYIANIIPFNLISIEEYKERKKERKQINKMYQTWFGEKWKEEKKFLHTWIGCVINKSHHNDKALFLFGGGGEGKGSFIERIREMIGVHSVSSLTLENLKDKFAAYFLFQKLLNIDTDFSIKNYESLELFKKIVTKDPINVEKKGGSFSSVSLYCSLVISTNDIPKLKEYGESIAIRRRVSFCEFKTNIEKLTKKDIEEFINFKLDKRSLETELFEIMFCYKNNYNKLRGNYSSSHNKWFNKFIYENNDLLRWFKNRILKGEYFNEIKKINKSKTKKIEKQIDYKKNEEWFNDYVNWCKKFNEENQVNWANFIKRLQSLLKSISLEIIIENDYWVGLKELNND